MSDSPTSKPETAFVCACDRSFRSACAGEPFYKEHEGKRYCVLHFPEQEKGDDFQKVFQRKLDKKDFNFRGVWFPDELRFSAFDFSSNADFNWATFMAKADFISATFRVEASFSRATFSAPADFRSASFSAAADFSRVRFSAEANFSSANFSAEVDFSFATFTAAADFISANFRAKASFRNATFNAPAYFNSATFSAVAVFRFVTFNAPAGFNRVTFSAVADFISSTSKDYVRFSGDKDRPVFPNTASLDLQFARIENPDRISFHTLVLRPHWFVNVDARKFDFTNVDWWRHSINEETESLKRKDVSSPDRMLAIACRHLAVNAEENHRYEEASRFRYMAMDVRRLKGWRGFAFWRLSWWYWLASGYGERVSQAFLVLLGIWLLAALLYNHVGFARSESRLASDGDAVVAKRDEIGAPLPRFGRALTYSAGVMTLQKPEPRPATTAAQTVVLLETILGPVQAALLALAIRRKFMR